MMKSENIPDNWNKLNYLEKIVLSVIYDKGEITSEEAAKLMERSKPTVVKLLNKLIDMKLIEWTGTSKKDNHGKYIIVQLNIVKYLKYNI